MRNHNKIRINLIVYATKCNLIFNNLCNISIIAGIHLIYNEAIFYQLKLNKYKIDFENKI